MSSLLTVNIKNVVIVFLFLSTTMYAQTLPNIKFTPGAVRIIDSKIVCSTKWGKDVRHVTQSMKVVICKSYNAKDCPGQKWELDHLIPRELGGADAIANIWAQDIIEAKLKDRLENWLHKQVCVTHTMTLSEARKAISIDWYKAYLKMQ